MTNLQKLANAAAKIGIKEAQLILVVNQKELDKLDKMDQLLDGTTINCEIEQVDDDEFHVDMHVKEAPDDV